MWLCESLKIRSFLFIFMIFAVSGCSKNYKIAADGNLLFYNNPVTLWTKSFNAHAYLTSAGSVELLIVNKPFGNRIRRRVHDYSHSINKNRGPTADDHAAPAITIDSRNKTILLATSYHSSNLFIYKIDLRRNFAAELIAEISGRFTYPRFVTKGDEIMLFVRSFENLNRSGHLSYFSSTNNFSKEVFALRAKPNTVIYAGSIVPSKDNVAFAYSVLNYARDKQKRLPEGLNFAVYSPRAKKISTHCNLEKFLDPESLDVRPTGIGFKSNQYLIGASYRKNALLSDFRSKNFSIKNKAILLFGEGHKCSHFKVLDRREILMPYYSTSISINEDLDWIYFDKNRVYSNLKDVNCAYGEKLMYPNLSRHGVTYAKMSQNNYSIRDFKNSLHYCTVPSTFDAFVP